MVDTTLVYALLVFGAAVALYWWRRRVPGDETWLAWAQTHLRDRLSTHRLPLKLKNMVGATVASLVRVPDLTESLSPAARALVDQCYDGVDTSELMDYHTHLFGSGGGCCESGCLIPPEETRDLRLHTVSTVFMKCAGIRSVETGDQDFVEMLARLTHGKHVLLSFDKNYREDGTVDEKRTTLHTPDDWVWRVCQDYPDSFIPSCSVHPYRKDALEALELAASRGVRLIKWLPNSMNIDPMSPKCDPFYDTVKRLGMVILSHAGEEKAVEADPRAQELGNPLRVSRALNKGVKVIVAHCASLGTCEDLESPLEVKPQVSNFELFFRMMERPEWEGLLFGDISAIVLLNRMRYCKSLLSKTQFHHRLVNGTDYPLPMMRFLNLTMPFYQFGLITKAERNCLNEIYEYSPVLYDFCLKRTMKGPHGERLPPSLFQRNRALW